MRSSVALAWFALGLSVVACSSPNGDDDDGGQAGAASGTTSTGGSGGSAAGGTGGAAATGGGATGGSSGTGGGGTQPIPGGPHPFPQNKTSGACTLTTYPNASAAVQAAYDYWKSRFVVAAPGGLRVQRPEQSNDTVSEGIAYGMLMAVYMNDRPTFDGLWGFAKQHLDANGLMNWHLTADGAIASGGNGSATDADEDMAWGLVMASAQWSAGSYLDEAKIVINAMFTYERDAHGVMLPGDAWGSTTRTYPDYFSPAYFRVFAEVTHNPNWSGVVLDTNYAILDKVSGTYGLVPDYTTSDTYDLSQSYSYDACRTPWRIGMDYCFNGEPRAKAYLDKIGAFFDGQGVSAIGDRYSPAGMKTSSFGNMAFIGPAGVSGMAGHQKLLDDAFTYGATGNGGDTQYYQQSLRVITMLMMSGNLLDYTQ